METNIKGNKIKQNIASEKKQEAASNQKNVRSSRKREKNHINIAAYRFIQFICWIMATFVFKRKVTKNELKGVKGPYVVIANHECALDFVELIGLNRRPMNFVISNAFYSTLPLRFLFDAAGVIPKQQFQTTTVNLKRIKSVIDSNNPLVIYPAGLMCEDGLSTPIPVGTYKFLKWLGVDVYLAKVTGSYFVMPKWSKGLNAGRTYMSVTKLFDKEELAKMDLDTLKDRTRKALLFDAYREQSVLNEKYKKKGNIEGLEKVLYMCPKCESEFTIELGGTNALRCGKCGFEAVSDEYYMLSTPNLDKPIKLVSDWSKMIQKKVEQNLLAGIDTLLEDETDIHMINEEKKKFELVGHGKVSVTCENIVLDGSINGKEINLKLKTTVYPTLPFKPGKCFELQDGNTTYRLVLNDGKRVMKYINTIKAYYRIEHGICDDYQ